MSGTIAFWLGAIAALLTSFYSWRLIFLTFFGEPRWAASEHIQHALHGDHDDHPDAEHGDSAARRGDSAATGTAGYHPHESPLTMLVPIACSRSARVFAGQIFHGIFIDAERAPDFWRGSGRVQPASRRSRGGIAAVGQAHADRSPCWSGCGSPGTITSAIRGAAGALRRDLPRRSTGSSPTNGISTSSTIVIFVRPALWLGRLFWQGGDEGTIDRFGPHGAAFAVGVGNRVTARFQSGYLYSYALVMLLGLIGAASWAIWWAR